MKNIIIIGGGWYGCHTANLLNKYLEKFNIILIESKKELFDSSSYYNQNRLHLGYHYCRDFNTRSICKTYYKIFVEKYGFCIDNINNNYYLVSTDSIVDYTTYNHIYTYEGFKFDIINNSIFSNIYDSILKVDEQVINSNEIKNYFKKELCKNNIIYNTKVISYTKNNNIIKVQCNDNKEYTCDILIDCTYNQLGLSKKKYFYELTISLLYKKIKNVEFDAITIVDGNFCSLYPRDITNNIYTLTDVEYTPIIKSINLKDIENYTMTDTKLNEIKINMCKKIKKYYSDFDINFEYIDYFLSKKTKVVSTTDTRDINIDTIEENVYSVNCGKIYGIFLFEKFLFEKLHL